jgi:molybdopterin-guanine dinucleotide biosynthesis protein A
MGSDKARLRLGSRTMLGQIKAIARKTGWPVRIIRRDIVPRCGPAGGVHTALATTENDVILFLACDMPFITSDLLFFILESAGSSKAAVFIKSGSRIGFPFLLSRQTLPLVTRQLRNGACSIQHLAKALKAKILRPPVKFSAQLLNLNTPNEWEVARRLWKRKQRGK